MCTCWIKVLIIKKKLTPNFWTLVYVHQSGIALWPLTGEVNNTDYLFITAPVIGWNTLGSMWTFWPQSWCVRSRKMILASIVKGQILMARRLGQSISKTAALVGCSQFPWGTHGPRMHYGKKASWRRQCDVLGNVLLGNFGSCHSCGCYFDTYHLPKHFSADHVHHFMEVVPNWSPITGLKGSAANILVPDATCLDGSGLFWQQKGDQQNIRKVVIMCLISVYM